MDKENGWDASANWNGYMYQGKVALLVALTKINEISDVTEFWLESEGIEDFSIGKGKGEKKEYESVHQVKNRKDNKMENYNEALSNIVKKIRDYPSIKRGFLHIKNEIITDNWKKEITDQMQNYYPQKIQELNAIVMKPELQKKIYDEILSMWNPNTHKINRRTNAMNKLLIDKMEKENNFQKKEDITEVIFMKTCRNVLEEKKQEYDFVGKEQAIDKIEVFKYSNGNDFADSLEVKNMTLEEIKKYWGDKAEYRKGKEDIYYIKLLGLINGNITNRAEQGQKENQIFLNQFKDILDKDTSEICETTKEEVILRHKLIYSTMLEQYCLDDICEASSEENCNSCKLHEISTEILSSSISELEAIFHIMALHKNEDLSQNKSELFSKTDLENSFFPEITEIDREFFFKQYKVLCQIDDKFMMSTIIDADRPKIQRKTIQGLVENDIQDVCQKVINNDNYDTVLMEIDKLITRNYDAEDIFETARDINIITEKEDHAEDTLKYMNITKTKKVGLISVEKAKEKYGARTVDEV